MNFIRLLPVLLSLLFLAAHFYRSGIYFLVVIILLSPFILMIRRQWAVRVIQLELIAGGIEWIRTLFKLVHIRQMYGVPWGRLSLILGGIAVFTFCSVMVFKSRSLRKRYCAGRSSSLCSLE
jgi:hypothetical protein